MSLRFLIVDAYPAEDRSAIQKAGGKTAGELYVRFVRAAAPGAQVEVIAPCDGDAGLPSGSSLEQFDGVCFTGSPLTVYQEDPRVDRHLELVRVGYESGLPMFGSCFAAQLAVTAVGGLCERNPAGREFGLCRVKLTSEGLDHPMFSGNEKREVGRTFPVLQSHQDHIVSLPPGSRALAENDRSPVQALAVRYRSGSFWAVQYHPEWTPFEIGVIGDLRAEFLVGQGCFQTVGTARDWASRMKGGGAEGLSEPERILELKNWIEHEVLARASRR